jgi:hypothetical protein
MNAYAYFTFYFYALSHSHQNCHLPSWRTYVCLSFQRHVTARLSPDRFPWRLILETFVKMCCENWNLITFWKYVGHFTWKIVRCVDAGGTRRLKLCLPVIRYQIFGMAEWVRIFCERVAMLRPTHTACLVVYVFCIGRSFISLSGLIQAYIGLMSCAEQI